jgi:hypothetical protein
MKYQAIGFIIFLFSANISCCDYICLPIVDTMAPINYSTTALDSVFQYYYDNSNYIFSGNIISQKSFKIDTLSASCCSICICRYTCIFYDSIDYLISTVIKGDIKKGDTLHFYHIYNYTNYLGGECDMNEGNRFLDNSLIFNASKDGFFPYQLHSDNFIERECGAEKSTGQWFYFNPSDSSLSLFGYPGLSIKLNDVLNTSVRNSSLQRKAKTISICYNSNSRKLSLSSAQPFVSATLEIFDISGKIVQHCRGLYGRECIFNFKQSRGLYLFKIQNNGNISTRSFLLN